MGAGSAVGITARMTVAGSGGAAAFLPTKNMRIEAPIPITVGATIHLPKVAFLAARVSEPRGWLSNAPCIARRTSPMSRSRSFGSFSRQRHSTVLMAGGTSSDSVLTLTSDFITDASVSDTSSPWKARRPVSISNSTHPNAQMSVRLSTVFPRACSGDIYAAVPMITPICVAPAVSVGDCDGSPSGLGSSAFARPKSNTLTVPSSRTLMFAGLRSRWITPASCAASSASAICFAIGRASSSGIGPFEIRSTSVGPSTSSSTSARVPSASSMP